MSTNIQVLPGKVGISNTSPTHTLDIGSNVYVDDTAENTLTVTGKIYTTEMDVTSNLEVGTANLFVDTTTGRVGLGTSQPAYALDVHGTANVGALTATTGVISGDLEVDTNTLKVDTTQNRVGILTTTPEYTLDVHGMANVGAITMNSNVYAPNLHLADVASNLVTWNSATGDLVDSGGLISNKLAIVSEQPPAVLTGDSTVVDGHGIYKVTTSLQATGYDAYKAFDKTVGVNTNGWSSGASGAYNSDGTYAGSNSLASVNGEWVKIEFPYKTTLRHIALAPRDTNSYSSMPEDFSIVASNDDSTWVVLKSVDGQAWSSIDYVNFVVNATTAYKYYAIVVELTNNNFAQIGEWKLFTESFAVDGGKVNTPGPTVFSSDITISGKVKTSEIEEVTSSINTPFNIDVDIIGTWLNADNAGNIVEDSNGKVTKVYDETSLRNDFTVSADRGVTYDSSKGMIYFDGRAASTNHMEAQLPSSVTTDDEPYCFTVVVETHEPPSVTSTVQLIANLFNSVDDGTDRRHNLYLHNGNKVHSHAGKTNDILINRQRTRTKYIATVNFDGTTASLYVNGLFASETTEVTTSRTSAVLRIGTDSDNNNTYSFKSWLGEAIFFTRNLTEDELINLHKYLNSKWNVYKTPMFDIFTAAGQSNMSGRAGDATATVQPDYGREFDPQYWTPATKTPLKLIRDPVGAVDTIDTGSTGSCLPAFCEEYYKQTGRECIILYCAKGGSSIFNSSQWDIDFKDTNYVKKSIDILKNAEITLKSWGYEVKNKSILWHQGESDQARTTAAYKAKFLELYDYWISNGYDNVFYYEISRTAANQFVNPRAVQREVWKDRTNLHLVFSCYKFYDQGKFSDSIHYSPEGYDEMGREGAKSAAKVLNATKNATVEKVLDLVPGGTSSTSGIKIPYGTTAQRPTNAQDGTLRYNTELNALEYHNTSSWFSLGILIDGSSESRAAQSATALYLALGGVAQDGLYYLILPGMSQAEQFYIYFNKEFASEGAHNYVVLSTYGRDGGGIFTTSNWTNTGTIANVDPRTATTKYSRLHLLDTIFPTIGGKYYIWLQNKLETTGNPWIEWVSAQTANPYSSKSSSVDVAGRELIFRTSGISGWGEFGGYHNQSVSYDTSGGKIVGSRSLGNWYWNAALTEYWGDNIPVSAGSVTYTYDGTAYNISNQSGESRHNIFAVAN